MGNLPYPLKGNHHGHSDQLNNSSSVGGRPGNGCGHDNPPVVSDLNSFNHAGGRGHGCADNHKTQLYIA